MVCRKVCGGILAAGFLTVSCGAYSAGYENSGEVYASLWGTLSTASFGAPSVKNAKVSGKMLGTIKSHGSLASFSLSSDSTVPNGFSATEYSPVWKESPGVAGGFGYRRGSLMLQLSASSESFKISESGYSVKENASYFVFDALVGGGSGTSKKVIGHSDRVGVDSLMLSACYSGIGSSGSKVKAYPCLGLGAAFIDYWGSRGRADTLWSAGMGVECFVSQRVSVFAEAHYRGVLGKKGEVLVMSSNARDLGGLGHTLASDLKIGYFSGVSGVRYTL